MTKAYSYLRFSTPEQMKGDSLRRQIELARTYASARGLQLDEELTFRDLGVSAFKGRNAEVGKLADFKEAIKEGFVPRGSYLLVESLDRISRQAARKALRVLEAIVDEDITVVTLADGREYHKEALDNDPMALMMSLLIFIRANEESVAKSRRLKAAYANKRRILTTEDPPSKPFTRRLPGWLRWDQKRRAFELIPERAEVIQTIFRLADAGMGQHAIARALNEAGATPFDKAAYWHRSYIVKVLKSPAVVGTFIPCTKEPEGDKIIRRPLEPRKGYWPAAVAPEVFERVSARQATRSPRGRHANAQVTSVVAGVAQCSHCGGSMTRVSKGRWRYVVCSKAHAKAGCKYQALKYEDVEQALRQNAKSIFTGAPRGEEAQELETFIWNADVASDALIENARGLTDELVRTKSDTVRERLNEVESEIHKLFREIDEAKAKREKLTRPFVLRRLENMRDALVGEPFDVAQANKAIREAVERIVIYPEEGNIEIFWSHGGSSGYLERVPVWSRHDKTFDPVDPAVLATLEGGALTKI